MRVPCTRGTPKHLPRPLHTPLYTSFHTHSIHPSTHPFTHTPYTLHSPYTHPPLTLHTPSTHPTHTLPHPHSHTLPHTSFHASSVSLPHPWHTPTTSLFRATMLHAGGALTEALDLMNKAVQCSPNNAGVHMFRGQLLDEVCA